MGGFYKDTNKGAKNAIAEDGRWLIAESAIVADNKDPERQHRIRVIIPSIDEDMIYDQWIRPMAFCVGDGFGSVFIPPKGAEVFITGALGQKFNLFYSQTYNEEMFIPSELSKDVFGIHVPKDLLFIADENAELRGANAKVQAAQLAEIIGGQVSIEGGQVTINADGSITISGGSIAISGGSIAISSGNVTIGGGNLKLHGRTVNPVGGPI